VVVCVECMAELLGASVMDRERTLKAIPSDDHEVLWRQFHESVGPL